MRFSLPLLFCLLLSPALGAQEKKDTKRCDRMIEQYLAAETDKLAAKVLDGAKTLAEWQTKRPRLHREYLDMLGLWPLPEKTPLKATKTGEVEAHGVVVEKIHFQSKPGLYVTANVYRPKANKKSPDKLPAIVYVCGHSWKGRDGNKSAHQDHGFWFANNGYLCIILDTLQLGEIPGVHHGTYGTPWRHIGGYTTGSERKLPENIPENRFWWHSIGYSPAAVECWNGIRAIDYLSTRPDVDAARIGVTGISGGGAATFWIAAADDRVKVAVPVSGMADLEYYVKQKGINGHCDCMFLYNTGQWDWTTIAALVAPRPLLFANSDSDPIFPMDANRRVIAKLKKLYTMYEKPNLVDEYVSAGGHAYRPDLRIAIFKFFNKHLKGDTKSKVEDCAKYTPLKGSALRVFPEDADLPKDAINDRIDETFIPAAKVVLPEKGKFAEWKKGKLSELRATSFRLLPAVNVFTGSRSVSSMISGKKVDRIAFLLSEEEVKDRPKVDKLIAKYAGESEFHCFQSLFFGLPQEGDNLDWSRKSPPNNYERSHTLLGHTIDERRVVNFMATLEAHRYGAKDAKWTVAGTGQMGIVAAYAALFDSSIKEVIVIDPPKSHKQGPHFLNVLRVLDIPEALGLLAPTPLTIIGGQDPAFDRTAELYRLAGAADKLKRR